MKTKHERNKRLEFLQAYMNSTNRHVLFSGGRSCGRVFLHKIFQKAKNYLVQEQNAHKACNSLIQANFAEAEVKAISNAIKNGDFDSEEYHNFVLGQWDEKPIVKITKTTGSGSSYSADCPKCGKTKILGSELNTMSAVCDKCYTAFNLER